MQAGAEGVGALGELLAAFAKHFERAWREFACEFGRHHDAVKQQQRVALLAEALAQSCAKLALAFARPVPAEQFGGVEAVLLALAPFVPRRRVLGAGAAPVRAPSAGCDAFSAAVCLTRGGFWPDLRQS